MLIFQKFFNGMSGVFSRILLAVFPILAHITQFHYCFVKYTTDFQIRKPTFCLKNRCVRVETQAATTHNKLISPFSTVFLQKRTRSTIGHKSAKPTMVQMAVATSESVFCMPHSTQIKLFFWTVRCVSVKLDTISGMLYSEHIKRYHYARRYEI